MFSGQLKASRIRDLLDRAKKSLDRQLIILQSSATNPVDEIIIKETISDLIKISDMLVFLDLCIIDANIDPKVTMSLDNYRKLKAWAELP